MEVQNLKLFETLGSLSVRFELSGVYCTYQNCNKLSPDQMAPSVLVKENTFSCQCMCLPS